MPKKKLANMTEEERILYMEQQRLEEEAAQKKKEDLLSQFLKDKLSKEEKATKANTFKLNHQWRTLMREAKSKQLKLEIEILSQTFERVVDRKDAVIKSLLKDLQEAEDQYSLALSNHLQNVDKLLEFQKRRLEDLKHGYTEELSAVKEEFESELSFVKHKQERVMQELQDIVYAMEHDFLEDEELSKQEFQSLCDELKNKNLEEKHSLRVQLESQVEDLWAQFQQALKAYTEATEEKKKQYETLKAKDESSAQEIEMQMRKIQKVSERIAQVKARMLQNQRENEERNRLLRMQKDKTVQQFQGLKAQMQKEHEKNRALLEKMVVESKKSLKSLVSWTEKGEKLLKLAEICRKMETEMEKVLPFYSTSLTQEERADVEAALRENAAASLNERLSQLFFSYLDMEQFYQRYNKALLDKLSLDKEKQVLSTENAQLRALLKQYLDGISVNEEVIGSLNPLFVVNYKTNVNLATGPQGAGKKQPVVLEASSEARKLRLVS